MIRAWTRGDTIAFLRVPTAADDKYSRGVVALHTGSAAYPGAAVLGVEAAWRAGAGYVRYTGGAADAALARRPETVAGSDIGRTRVGAWVIGSGTDAAGRTPDERAMLLRILAGTAPVVVDAGALDLAREAAAPTVLTPHAGELRRLREELGLTARSGVDGRGPAAESSEAALATEAEETAQALGSVVLRKGAVTLVAAPGQQTIRVDNGPAWLSTAGTGDVLAGVIGALLAANPGRELSETAAAAAWLHGHAATVASGARDGAPGHPIVALDVAEALPAAIGELLS
ncbi:NAD(P)H-hydrate dehydratase [Microbacterium sp. YJN-G]|uniref:ADP-dependent NAD(P)H-hydrate dehydratase n=1 Tax=Microbacterium sp. YJN-G TaxID=2763257 RepID=UPI0018782467|nr:ADP/ATP-dependent (S)-NAD(P)H-hydrate dehydratase [Microbacterium sp. YJN-G]